MKVVIIEDEILSQEHLQRLLKRIDVSIEVIACIDSVRDSVAFFSENPNVDLVFMDIHLADGLSFEIFKEIGLDLPIIFTTAFDQYTLNAFKVNSIDYLLKPIGLSELEKSLQKFQKLNRSQQELLVSSLTYTLPKFKTRFMVKLGENISSIQTNEIHHFTSEDGLTLLVAKTGKRYPIDFTLDQLEMHLDPQSFHRINRKVWISIDAVNKVVPYFNSRMKIHTDFLDEEACIVARDRVSNFKDWLG